MKALIVDVVEKVLFSVIAIFIIQYLTPNLSSHAQTVASNSYPNSSHLPPELMSPTNNPQANVRLYNQSSTPKSTQITNLRAQKENCGGPHKTWDNQLNSCMTVQDSVDFRNDFNSCARATKPQDCYLKNAEEKTNVEAGDRGKDNKTAQIAQMVAGAYSLFSLVAGKAAGGAGKGGGSGAGAGSSAPDGKGGGGKGMCPSKMAFAGTSLAWIVGDLFLRKDAKEKFEEIAKRYDQEAKNVNKKGDEGDYSAQMRAFEYLKEEQEQVKNQAEQRQKLQIGVAAGYGISAALAAYESFTVKGKMMACRSPDKGSKAGGAEGATGGADGATGSADASSSASTDTGSVESTGADGKPLNFGSQVVKIGTSPQILLASGVMLGLTGYLAFQANEEKKRAEKNIEEIDKIIETYGEFLGGMCPNGREDLNNARCYCYTSDGNKNLNRTNSVICQNLFAADEVNLAQRKEKEIPVIAEQPRRGCMTVNGQFDLECRCREMKNTRTGANACAKSVQSNFISGGLGSSIGAPGTLKAMDNISNGANKGIAALDTKGLRKRAAKNNRILNSVLKQAQKKGEKVPDLTGMEKESIKLMSAEGRRLAQTNPNYANLNPLGNSSFSPSSLASEIAEAKENLNLDDRDRATVMNEMPSRSIGSIQASRGKKSGGYNWNDSGKNTVFKSYEDEKSENELDDYDFSGSDIVNRQDVSLWKVISRRYQKSGLKRLFEKK